jgi:LAS superfamily LD-carboxypeptidase LdcB
MNDYPNPKSAKQESKSDLKLAVFIGLIIVLILSGFVAYQYRLLNQELFLREQINTELTTLLAEEERESQYLLEQTREKQAIIDSFQGQIEALGGTVGDLTKLANTDEELLRKYSKVYFLSENYVPGKLEEIDREYLHEDATNFLIHADVWPHLKRLLDSAHRQDVDLLVASAFRSFDTQASLKAGYTVIYGSGANQFSADQGYSEHQLGTSVDFTTSEIGGVFSKFADDEAYQWLLDNAHLYGFTLSYPEGNAFYKFEPWHWRFVGVELASHLHNERKHFYDLSQREIDSYLIKLFD